MITYDPLKTEYPYQTERYERYDGVTWRYDRNLWKEHSLEGWFAVSTTDVSKHHDNSGGYDARCSTCWLGFGHTEDYHQQNVREALIQAAKFQALEELSKSTRGETR